MGRRAESRCGVRTPRRRGPIGEAAAQTSVLEQLVWMGRAGGDGREEGVAAVAKRWTRAPIGVVIIPALAADRSGCRRRSRPQYVDEIVVGERLEPDVGRGGEEGGNDARERQP